MSQYADVCAMTPTEWQKHKEVAVLAFSLNDMKIQQTHLK